MEEKTEIRHGKTIPMQFYNVELSSEEITLICLGLAQAIVYDKEEISKEKLNMILQYKQIVDKFINIMINTKVKK